MTSHRKPNSFVPKLTALENREVPAVVGSHLSGGVLSVVCDNNATNVLVSQTLTNVFVQDVTTNRFWSYSASQVGRVDVFGGAGADALVSVGPAKGKLVRMFGMGGADLLQGGKGRETLNGGGGADTLNGRGGNDKLIGGNGNDQIRGGDGDDTIDGGAGDDWINGDAGTDTLDGGAGTNTIISIDGGSTDTITTGDGKNYIWNDNISGATDVINGFSSIDVVNSVDKFSNVGADTTLDGDRIPDPIPLDGNTYERFTNRPLFSPSGPQVFDIQQGQLGDCWMLAGLGSAAYANPENIKTRVVDFGDGTYGVHLGDYFFRVDNDLVVNHAGDQRLNYTSLGKGGSVWAAVMEKAYADFRTLGSNSYPSIEGGRSMDVFTNAFKSTGTQLFYINVGTPADPQAVSDEIVKMMARDPVTHKLINAATLGVFDALPSVPLVTGHQFVVLDYAFNDFLGQVSSITIYNPWGIDGEPNPSNPNDGIITITLDQLVNGVAGSLEYAPVTPLA